MGNVAAFITKSLERGAVGVPISRKAAFLQVGRQKSCEAATLILSEPLRLRHLPYPRSARGRGGLWFPNLAIQLPYLLVFAAHS